MLGDRLATTTEQHELWGTMLYLANVLNLGSTRGRGVALNCGHKLVQYRCGDSLVPATVRVDYLNAVVGIFCFLFKCRT